MEAVIASVAILGQLETIYMIIDKIVHYQQTVCRYKDLCQDFVTFVKTIETALRTKALSLKTDQERKFSKDVKNQLDKLEEHLRCAAVLLENLESPLRLAAYTGGAENKITELRGQLTEAVMLLTFLIVCSPSEKQPEQEVHVSYNPAFHEYHHKVPIRDRPKTPPETKHSISPPECHSPCCAPRHHPVQTHQTVQTGGGSEVSSPSHRGNEHRPSLSGQDPLLTERNLFRTLSPYHNPSPEYAQKSSHSKGNPQIATEGDHLRHSSPSSPHYHHHRHHQHQPHHQHQARFSSPSHPRSGKSETQIAVGPYG